MLKHCLAKELLSIIKDFAELNECEIYSDNLKSYNDLQIFYFVLSCNCVVKATKACCRIKYVKFEFVKARKYINDIKNFLLRTLATVNKKWLCKG
ncbi:hypothetical protein DMC01_03670 [Campylobacter troglodytis]|nr:hypothetical protein DMC01_03670 [Campylobacter troglodytis]